MFFFNCSAGKDRTGVIAFLILMFCNCYEEDIVADYSLGYIYLKSDIDNKRKINNKKLNDISKTITSFKKKLNKNNSIVDNLYKDKIEGLLSEKDFSRMYQEYTKDSNSLTDKIEDLQKELEQIKVENQDNKYDECKKIIQEFFKLKKPIRNVIARLVDRVEVSEKKEIDIYFKFK